MISLFQDISSVILALLLRFASVFQYMIYLKCAVCSSERHIFFSFCLLMNFEHYVVPNMMVKVIYKFWTYLDCIFNLRTVRSRTYPTYPIKKDDTQQYFSYEPCIQNNHIIKRFSYILIWNWRIFLIWHLRQISVYQSTNGVNIRNSFTAILPVHIFIIYNNP